MTALVWMGASLGSAAAAAALAEGGTRRLAATVGMLFGPLGLVVVRLTCGPDSVTRGGNGPLCPDERSA